MTDDTNLPPELETFAALLDAQAPPIRIIFHYALCLMMVERGVMRLIDTIPGDEAELCLFETSVGEQFTIPKPAMSAAEEAELLKMVREVLDEVETETQEKNKENLS